MIHLFLNGNNHAGDSLYTRAPCEGPTEQRMSSRRLLNRHCQIQSALRIRLMRLHSFWVSTTSAFIG